MGDLYRHYSVMQAGWNVFSMVLQCTFLFVGEERTVSLDICAAVVTQWMGKHW